jgi:hypothetical protein
MSKIIASTIAGLNGAPTFTNGVNVTGIATVTTLSATTLNVTGIATVTTLNATTLSATTITATNYTGIPATSDWRDGSLF